ncbi:MAG TPA: DUF4232 domain-containing protein [Leifsonia sp.]|jgi:hypothetical protein
MPSLRIATASLFALGLAVALTACATGATPATTGSDTPSSTGASSRPTGTSTPQPVQGQCDTSDLSGSITSGGGGAAGSVAVTLVLTNTGAKACTLQGWPGVSFVGDGNGTQLGAAAEQDTTAPHPTVSLAPGGTATAPLRIAQALNYSSGTCSPQKPDGLRVYPPGSTTALFVSYTDMTACASKAVSLLTVGGLVQG